MQFPSISPDGKVIAYENEFELWTVDVPTGSPKKVTIDMAFDPKDNLITWVNVRNRAEGFSPNHEGDYLVVDQRGEIFIVPTDGEVGEKTQVTDSARRDQGGIFSPDGRYIAYLSDESKEQEVWIFDRTTNARRKVSTHPSFKEMGFWSPDSKKIAYGGGNRLFMADVDSGSSVELAYNQAGGYQLSGFSPDGKWLVYTKRDDDQNAEVFLMDIATKAEHNATANPFADSRGTITPDGTRLIFLSDRDGGVTHLFSAPLLRQREDPDDPLVKERLKKARPERREQNATPAPPPPPPAQRVEAEGIGRRAVQLTRGEQAIQTYFLSADGRLIYFRSTDERGPGFFSINVDGTDRKRVTEGAFAGLVPSGDRRKVFYTQDDEIWQMEMSGDRRKSRVAFALAVKVDQRAEWDADPRRIVAGDEVPLLRREDARPRLGGDQEEVRAAVEVCRREPGRLRPGQRDDRRAQRVAHRRQRPAKPRDARCLHDAPPGFRAERGERVLPRLAHLPRRPRRQGVDRPQEGRLRPGGRRQADQGRRQLLAAAEQPAERLRHDHGGVGATSRNRAPQANASCASRRSRA